MKKIPPIFIRIFTVSWDNIFEHVIRSKFVIPILFLTFVISGSINYVYPLLNEYVVSSSVLIIITIIMNYIMKISRKYIDLQSALDKENERRINTEKKLDGMNQLRNKLDNKIRERDERISDLEIENRNLKKGESIK